MRFPTTHFLPVFAAAIVSALVFGCSRTPTATAPKSVQPKLPLAVTLVPFRMSEAEDFATRIGAATYPTFHDLEQYLATLPAGTYVRLGYTRKAMIPAPPALERYEHSVRVFCREHHLIFSGIFGT